MSQTKGFEPIMSLGGDVPKFPKFYKYFDESVEFLRGYMKVKNSENGIQTLEVIDVPTQEKGNAKDPRINFLKIRFLKYDSKEEWQE